MDSRGSYSLTPPPSLQQHHQPHHYQQQQQQLPPGMMMPPNFYSTNIDKNANLITPNSMQQPFLFNSDQYGDGSSASGGVMAGGYTIEPEKKKRGRPRKYPLSSDGGTAIGLASAPVNFGGNLESVNDGNGGSYNVDLAAKKHRGRPAGSVKRQLDALGVAGVGFTPHVITVKEGEDIASTMVAFSKEGPRTICILAANGSISNVTLQLSSTSGATSADTVTYEGRFEIISLSGSFAHSESDGNHSKSRGLSVSLAGSDGRVLGGGVAGVLVAASPVQVIVGSFIADGKKTKSSIEPSPGAPPNMLSFSSGGGAGHGLSPQSEGPSSESSDESGGSPIDTIPGFYNNATQHQQPQQQQPRMHNLSMYSNLGWPSSNMNMFPN